jgi:hypothetical protein
LVGASNWPFLFDRVKLTTFSFVSVDSKLLILTLGLLGLVTIPFLFFRAGTGVVAGVSPSGKFRLIGFCCVFTALGILLTSVVYHFEFPPGISDGLLPGVVT